MINRLTAAAVVAACAGSAFAQFENTDNYFGNVGALLVGQAFAALPGGTGDLAVSGMPDGATIKSAFVHTNSWYDPTQQSLTFNGTFVGTNSPFSSDFDPAGDIHDYRWDVTDLITGNGSYSFDVSGAQYLYGLALTVVYEHDSLPEGSVHIYEGVAQVGEGHTFDSETLTFVDAASGPAYMWLFTQADDTDTTGEELVYNGELVGGPIDANLGPNASVFYTPVTNTGAGEELLINTYGDWFGLHVAVLTTSTVPAPGTLGLLGLAGVVALRRRR